ncbi:MAG: excinuclease ABC subunit UvrC [Desulfobacterales bacterium]
MNAESQTRFDPEILSRKAAEAPVEPGVYLLRDGEGRILYVGKARRLRDRLAAYFRSGGPADPRIAALVARARDFEVILTTNEKEALILESNLIKRHRPRYNVVLKDDKRYPSLRLDWNEPYPRFTIVRRIGSDGAAYFGPFASARAVRETLKLINRTFKLRKCRLSEFRTRSRPCLQCQMNGCLAPCCREVPEADYRRQVEEAVLFLKGRAPELIRNLRRQMAEAAEREEFELAARLRDKLRALERTTEKQVAVSTDFVDRDVFAAVLSEDGAAVVTVLEIREGFLTASRNVEVPETIASAEELLGHFIRQFYEPRTFVPAEILVSAAPADGELIVESLASKREGGVRLIAPKRGDRARLVELARRNAESALGELLERRSNRAELLERLQRKLALRRLPRRIECIDHSSWMGKQPVVGLVCFVDGAAEPSETRRYRLPGLRPPDDYAALSDVLRRRLGEKDPTRPLADLLLIDGGKGQLHAALAVIRELGLEGGIDLAAIAKKDPLRGETRDKVFLPGRANPVVFGREEDLLLFLQRVRDEAHRCAVGFHRRRRRSETLASVLDEVPGLGPARKRSLLRRFQGVEALRAAGREEVAAVPGIGPKLAAAVFERLDGEGGISPPGAVPGGDDGSQ